MASETARFLRPYRLSLVAAAALTLLETALELARPWPLALAVTYAIEHRPLPGWLPIRSPRDVAAAAALVSVAIVAAQGAVAYGQVLLSESAAVRIGTDLRQAVLERLLRLNVAFHERHPTGELVNRLTSDVRRVQDALTVWFTVALPESLLLVGMLGVLATVDPVLAGTAVVALPLLAVAVLLRRARVRGTERRSREASGALAGRATELLSNVRSVQAFVRESRSADEYRVENDDARDRALAVTALEARLYPLSEVVLAAGSGSVLWLGVLAVLDARISLGALLVVLSYLSSVYGPVRRLTRMGSTLATGAASRERLLEILRSGDVVPEPALPTPLPHGPLELRFDHVTFGYRPGRPVLHDISFDVRPDELVSIVGWSGAGKSTLLSLVQRFHDAGTGVIRLGGIEVGAAELAGLRRRIALLPQEPWLLDGSIADNIRFGRTDVTLAAVRRAAEVTLVNEFADRLPHGLDTSVGEGGLQLSGGQRKRVALARAVLLQADVLLLDEPTSGLDSTSAMRVMQALKSVARGQTVLVVTHHLPLAAMSDRIVVLEHGRVVEAGTHAELRSGCGAYARLTASSTPPDSRFPISVLSARGGESHVVRYP